jgi:hypothetical protein
MTIPADPTLEAAPYGAQPVYNVFGVQGGPYQGVDATHGLPIEIVASSGTPAMVQGNIASGIADAGNPVKIGGVANSGLPTAVATGQRVDQWHNLRGAIVCSLATNAAIVDGASVSPVVAFDGNTLRTIATGGMTFNETNWDRQRGNAEYTLLASASRAATVQSADQTNYNGRRLLLIVNVSVVGTGSITPSLQFKDPISGNYVTVWTAAAAIVTGTTFAYVFADGAAGGTATEKLAFGLFARTWRLVITHNNANAITYSVSATVGV